MEGNQRILPSEDPFWQKVTMPATKGLGINKRNACKLKAAAPAIANDMLLNQQ